MVYPSLIRGLLIALALFALPQISFAITVKTVPWVATNPLIPHDTWSGNEITLKGTADVQGSNIQYAWDFGDGSPVMTGSVTNRYAIEARHTYTGATDTIFTARLTVQNTTTGESNSQNYFVQLRDRTLDVEVNVAIDEGLWYLHKNQYRYTSGGVDYGDWRSQSGCYSCLSYWGLYASNINAFEANGHIEAGAASDPYTETVARGLKALFNGLLPEPLSLQTYPLPTGTVNPDSNGNGYGVRVNQTQYAYQGGMVMDAILASGTPAAVTTTGQVPSGGNPGILGRTYADIVQDMVDSYAYGQYNANAVNRGSWRYTWNSGLDNSVSQWAAIGMIPAERNWGLVVPGWVKTENEVALAYSQSSDGRFGYTVAGYFPWGPYAVTPSGMVQMVMDGITRGDVRWDRTETFLRNTFPNTGGATNSIRDYYYGLFSFVKSMRLYQDTANPNGITLLGGNLDWYNAELANGDVTDGVARTLVNDQSVAGYWFAHDYNGNQYYFETAWAILMLSPTLFEAGAPVAVAQAIPNPGVVGQMITLDGGASYHLDASKHVDSWEWDFDNDGVYDATGAQVMTSFPAVGDYPVTLRVTDDGSPEKVDTTVVTVRITLPPVAPTADAGGPYVFCPNVGMFLDGTGSNNPDEGQGEIGQPGDTIQTYLWDLDGNGDFADAAGPQPDVTGYFGGLGVGDYLVQLRVTDTTATSYPSSGLGDLSDTDSAQVSVKAATDPACSCLTDLASRPKSGKVQLTWTDNGAHHYNVYRGTTAGGPYSKIAETTSRYSTYLDTTVVNEVTYFYVIRTAEASGRETCQSSETSAKPTATRRSRNEAPVITSSAVTSAVENSPYSYDVDAIDAEGGVLTYTLDTGPAGMSINTATGLIAWTPTSAQVGVHSVAVRATDPLGASGTQTFEITVANANRPPQFTTAPVTTATEGLAYSYDADAIDLDAGDVLTFSLAAAPAGMSIDPSTGLVSWTPTSAQVGNNLVSIVVTDAGSLSASQTFTIRVFSSNLPPSFTSTPIVTATVGVLYTYDVDATDPNPGDVLTYSLITPPAGMTIDPATGLISWTPTAGQLGDNTIQVQVADQDGASAMQAFIVTVNEVVGEGCDASFWLNNTGLWHPNYPPTMLFIDAFGRNAFPGQTLQDVLGLLENYDPANPVGVTCPTGGDPVQTQYALVQLGIQSVAAFQNAATPVNFDLDIPTVIQSFQQAFDQCTETSMLDAKSAFEQYNNQVCPY
jgi:hypothetical protein